jgi:ABC-type branched-subunit amino acid transport system substrate-binding protein
VKLRIRIAFTTLVAGGLTLSVGLLSGLPASAQGGTQSEPYTVVYEAQLSGSAANTGVGDPNAPLAFQAAFHGKPVTVNVCDDQGTTTGNIDCEHEAVADHAAAFVVTQSNQDQTVVDAANIPVLGVANDTAPQSFDISAQQGLFVGMAVAMEKKGCKRVGQVIDEGGQAYGTQVAKAVKWQSVTDSYISLTAADLSPYIAKLVQAHVQCVDMAMISTQIPQALQAVKQAGLKVPIAMPGVILTPPVISSLGALGNGLIEVISTPAINSSAANAVAKKIHAVNKSVKTTNTSLDSYATALIIQDAAAGIHGAVSNTSMLAALNKLRNASTDGLLPPISMKHQSNPVALRDFDTYVQTVLLENGQQTTPSGFFNVAPQINTALTNG